MPQTLLAIDTSGREGSLAVMHGATVLKILPLPRGQRTASTLAVQLRQATEWCASEQHKIEFVAVANGPGSFTGLRIGVTTAKVYCYATGLPLVAVNSIAAIAASTMMQVSESDSVLVGINAYRGQVFTGCFDRQSLLPELPPQLVDKKVSIDPSVQNRWRSHMNSASVLDSNEWREMVSEIPSTTAMAGESELFPAETRSRIRKRALDDAYGVGILGHYAGTMRQWVDPMQLSPTYIKSSSAEELAASRERR